MRSTILALGLLFIACDSIAQTDTTKTAMPDTAVAKPIVPKVREREVSLSLSYANGGMAFGLLYKKRLSKRTWYRLSVADISVSQNASIPEFTNQFPTESTSGSLNVVNGFEFRFRLHKLVETYTGVDLIVGFSASRYSVKNPALPIERQIDRDYALSAGIGFNSGIIVRAVQGFHVGVNLSPAIRYTYSPYDSYDDQGQLQYAGNQQSIKTYFNLSSVQLLFIYRWEAKPREPRAPRPPRPPRLPRKPRSVDPPAPVQP